MHPTGDPDCGEMHPKSPDRGTVGTTKRLRAIEAGVNRISLGVQSFQSEKLRLLGRIHDAEGKRIVR